jgi:hypothetical protein
VRPNTRCPTDSPGRANPRYLVCLGPRQADVPGILLRYKKGEARFPRSAEL